MATRPLILDERVLRETALTQLGVVNFFVLMPSSGREVGGWHLTRPLGGHDGACDLPPDLESVVHGLAMHGGREEVAPRSEMQGDGTVRREKALSVPWGCKLLHLSFPLPGRLVGIFRPIIAVAALPMFQTGQYLPFRRTIALQCIRHNHPGDVRQPLERKPFFVAALLRRRCTRMSSIWPLQVRG